jgi:hypothetical protein
MSYFQRRILIPTEMAKIHRAMTDRYSWFEHVGRLEKFDSYRTTGIQPRDPDREYLPIQAVEGQVGSPHVVCLRPIDSFNSTPNRGDRQFRMAFARMDLPTNIGIDRSHGSALALVAELHKEYPDWDDSAIFVEIAHRLGSFVSYASIKPAVLRVWSKGSSSYNPQTWPLLTAAESDRIEFF